MLLQNMYFIKVLKNTILYLTVKCNKNYFYLDVTLF